MQYIRVNPDRLMKVRPAMHDPVAHRIHAVQSADGLQPLEHTAHRLNVIRDRLAVFVCGARGIPEAQLRRPAA
ncbi:MAG: hypothetical protein AMXMBFR13_10190 [Phycisphaerae bacterium]